MMVLSALALAAVLHIDWQGQSDDLSSPNEMEIRCRTTDAWDETIKELCLMSVALHDKEPTPFMLESQRKQAIYEKSRREWKEAHPDVTRDELDAAEVKPQTN